MTPTHAISADEARRLLKIPVCPECGEQPIGFMPGGVAVRSRGHHPLCATEARRLMAMEGHPSDLDSALMLRKALAAIMARAHCGDFHTSNCERCEPAADLARHALRLTEHLEDP